MRRIITICLLALSGCGQPESEETDMKKEFFSLFGATDLGTTKYPEPSQTRGERGQLIKMLDLSAPDEYATEMLVSVRSEYSVSAAGVGQVGYPLTAILQWGTGGGQNQVEFDIPANRLPEFLYPYDSAPNQPTSNIGNGVQVGIQASHVSLYVRHDGNLGPLTNSIGDYIGSLVPAKVIAFVTPGTATGKPGLQRCIHVAGGMTIGPPATTPLLPAETIPVSVPPFARSFRIQRQPIGTPVGLTFFDPLNRVYREVNLGPNDEGPVNIDLITDRVNITNQSAGNIGYLQIVFDVTPS